MMDSEERQLTEYEGSDLADIDDYSNLPPSHPLYVEGIDDVEDDVPNQAELVLKAVGLLVGIGAVVAILFAVFITVSSYSTIIF